MDRKIKRFSRAALLLLLKSSTALCMTAALFLLFPALNALFKGERFAEKEDKITPRTILMEMSVKKPKPEKTKPQKVREISNLKARSTRSSQSKSLKFAPDLALGGGNGIGVESGGGFANMIFDEGDTDEPPMAIRRAPLAYPKAAQRARIEGTVEVVFLVNREGHVQDVEFKQVPHKMFEKPIRSTIMTWRFKPAMLKGVPVAVRVRQKIDFNLRQ